MPPRKRKVQTSDGPQTTKRLTKAEREKLIVKTRLDALEQEESLIKDERFSIEEKKRLLEAYNDHGFHVFHNPQLLVRYLPNRRVQDIKGLVQRLQSSLQNYSIEQSQNDQPDCSRLDDWEKLCNQLTRNFAKDRKVNLDDVFAHALELIAGEFKQTQPQEDEPNYSELLDNFAQLIAGKFPDKTSSINAQISTQVFEHINSLVDSIDLGPIVDLFEGGEWLKDDSTERLRQQEMALDGLRDLKVPLTYNEMEKNRNLEALCLELPKIKRLTEILNPLRVNRNLMELANKLETFVDDK